MTRTVAWVALAASAPMGQQVHEGRLQGALRSIGGDAWRFRLRSVSPLRSRGEVRLPLRATFAAPYRVAAAAARVVYGRSDLVHRFDLRCPPGGPEVATVHDLPPLRFDDEGTLPRWAAESARRAALVICPSEFAADEVRSLLGVTRVRVVPNGVDAAPVDPLDERELETLGIRTPYVLHAGGATRRKNLDALAAAWRRLDADGTLVLCGPPHPARERLLADLPRAVYLGHLDHALTVRLMRSAEAVVVPSLYEGFGLPALEAMAVGTPVVAARRGALPEVCGGAAILVEPTAEGLAEGLAEALADGARLRELGPRRAAAFTWERAAAQTLAAYEEALA